MNCDVKDDSEDERDYTDITKICLKLHFFGTPCTSKATLLCPSWFSHWISNFLLPQKYVRTIFLAQELWLLEQFVLSFWMISRTKPSDNYFLSSSSRILFQKITFANLAVKGLSSTHPGVLHPLVPCILGRRCFWSCTTKNWSP